MLKSYTKRPPPKKIVSFGTVERYLWEVLHPRLFSRRGQPIEPAAFGAAPRPLQPIGWRRGNAPKVLDAQNDNGGRAKAAQASCRQHETR